MERPRPGWSLLLLLLLLAAAALLPTHAGEQPPIPLSPTEWAVAEVGDSGSHVRVDAFVDLVCVDTKRAWPTVQAVVAKYGRDVHWKFHLFPLPYHTWAYAVARGAYALAGLGNDSTTLKYFDLAFARQNEVLNGPTMDQTASEVQTKILGWLGEASGLPAPALLKAYTSSTSDMNTRFSFKYACLRCVYGTPTFVINQVEAPDLSADSTVADWSKHIDPLLAAAAAAAAREGSEPPAAPAVAAQGKVEVAAGGVRF